MTGLGIRSMNIRYTFVHKAPCRQILPRSQQSNNRGGSIDEASFKNLSPEAKKVFKEAQENILAINSSRMRALQELKSANEKIIQLEKKLEDTARQLNALSTRQQTLETPTGTPTTPISTTTITIVYETGWDQVYLHYQADQQPWTQLPGIPFSTVPGDASGITKSVTVQGNRVEFVLTNGKGRFDTPNPYGEPNRPRNYVINGTGTFLLKNGTITRLE